MTKVSWAEEKITLANKSCNDWGLFLKIVAIPALIGIALAIYLLSQAFLTAGIALLMLSVLVLVVSGIFQERAFAHRSSVTAEWSMVHSNLRF